MRIKKTLLMSAMGTAVVLGVLALPAPTMAAAVEGKLSAVDEEGRAVTVSGKKYRVSGSRTKIMIAGKEAKRDRLAAGMDCKVEGEEEASKIECK